MDPSWRPQEDAQTVLNEHTWLIGVVLTGVGYGIVLTLFIICFRLLLKTITNQNCLQRVMMLIFISLVFLFGTLFIGSATKMAQLSFIDERNFPGGPSAFEVDEFSIPIEMLGNVSFVLSNWCADALVVWRCMVIYRQCRYPTLLVMSVPVVAYLGSISLGICWLIQVSVSSPWTSSTINFTTPFLLLSLLLNITMTLAIVARLLVFRWRISSAIGPKYGAQYVGIAAMLIESAMLYSSCALFFLVPFILNHPLANLSLLLLAEVQIIAPLLIIYRVAAGDAWSPDTTNQILPRPNLAISTGQSTNRSQEGTFNSGSTIFGGNKSSFSTGGDSRTDAIQMVTIVKASEV